MEHNTTHTTDGNASEDITTGFVSSVLCQKDGVIRRELHSHNLTTRFQLLRIVNNISLKKHGGAVISFFLCIEQQEIMCLLIAFSLKNDLI